MKQITNALPALSKAERAELRRLLDDAIYENWQAETVTFRKLMRGKAQSSRPASKVVSEGRR